MVKKKSKKSKNYNVGIGDTVKIKRRYIVNDKIRIISDKGKFVGVQSLGGVDYAAIGVNGEVKLIPVANISEIIRVTSGKEPENDTFKDPSYV